MLLLPSDLCVFIDFSVSFILFNVVAGKFFIVLGTLLSVWENDKGNIYRKIKRVRVVKWGY